MQTPHPTVGGEAKSGLMPTLFLGDADAGETEEQQPAAEAAPAQAVVKAAPANAKPANAGSAVAAAKAALGKTGATKKVSAAEQAALDIIGNCTDAKDFAKKAIKIQAISADDAFMNRVLDDGPNGFYAQNKK
jgi:hypothetical protein